MKFCYILFFLPFTILCSCGNTQDKSLVNLTKDIENREQQLRVKEQTLKLKEIELIKREQLLDSTSKHLDSMGIYNASLIGNWHVSMHCIETSCAGSAIGDTKTEQWNISYQNNRVAAKVTSNKKINRIYTGFYKENNLQLIAHLQDTSTAITINLHPVGDSRLEGERVIFQEDNCKIIYAIQIDKLESAN